MITKPAHSLASCWSPRAMGCDVAQGYYVGRPQPGAPTLAAAACLARRQMVKS